MLICCIFSSFFKHWVRARPRKHFIFFCVLGMGIFWMASIFLGIGFISSAFTTFPKNSIYFLRNSDLSVLWKTIHTLAIWFLHTCSPKRWYNIGKLGMFRNFPYKLINFIGASSVRDIVRLVSLGISVVVKPFCTVVNVSEKCKPFSFPE